MICSLGLFVVTPDMHRVHHSIDPRETNSNYGFNLPWWGEWTKHGGHAARFLFATVSRPSRTAALVTATR